MEFQIGDIVRRTPEYLRANPFMGDDGKLWEIVFVSEGGWLRGRVLTGIRKGNVAPLNPGLMEIAEAC